MKAIFKKDKKYQMALTTDLDSFIEPEKTNRCSLVFGDEMFDEVSIEHFQSRKGKKFSFTIGGNPFTEYEIKGFAILNKKDTPITICPLEYWNTVYPGDTFTLTNVMLVNFRI